MDEKIKLLFIILGVVLIFLIYKYLRKKIIKDLNRIIFILNEMIDEKKVDFKTNDETLISKVEGKLKKLESCLAQKNSLIREEKDNVNSLIGDISHQLKTPLANIKIYNETLLNVEKNEQNLEYLNLMQGQVEKIEWLISSLFKTSRIENGVIKIQKEKCKLQDILVDIVEQSYLRIEEKEINLSIDNCEVDLFIDKKWTIEAIYNVFDNAIKYTQNKGFINIKCYIEEFFIKINIEDSGIGIRELELNNIFQRFYRGRNQSVIGAGIGLYLSRQIIEMQGGFITVKSEENKGSIFSIYLLK